MEFLTTCVLGINEAQSHLEIPFIIVSTIVI